MQSVKLITKSTGIWANLLDEVAYAARVSNPANQMNSETNEKLIRYLMRNKHWSPFEMVSICLEINTTRDIARQILRHRSFSFQEFCVAEGTLITTLTENGSSKKVPIEDLYKRQQSSQYSAMSHNLVRVFDETDKILKPAPIKEVFKTGKKLCYKLVLEGGKEIISTKDHKFLTRAGFKKLENIVEDDFVATNGKPVYQDKEWLEKAKTKAIIDGTGVQGIADEANCSYHTIRKWLRLHGLQFSKQEVASYTTVWNKGLPTEQQPRFGKITSEETKQKQRASARKGKDSNLYVNGNKSFDTIEWRDRVTQVCSGFKNRLVLEQGKKCNKCGLDTTDLSIDHILPVYSNPEKALQYENLQLLCSDCHKKKSKEESLSSKYTVKYKKVKSIEVVGELETYDIEVDHDSHNYVANGIITHNSQRYADASALGDFEFREARLQDTKNRQNSIETDDLELEIAWKHKQQAVAETVETIYQWALDHGIAKEQARAVLPEGMTKSKMYMNGTLRSWIHYIELRSGNGTQKEHREIARMCAEAIKPVFPMIMEFVDGYEEERVREANEREYSESKRTSGS